MENLATNLNAKFLLSVAKKYKMKEEIGMWEDWKKVRIANL